MSSTRMVSCPHCNTELEIEEEDGPPQELVVDCPACQEEFTIPPRDEAPPKRVALRRDRDAQPAPAPAPVEGAEAAAFCPQCGAAIQDTEAVLCVSCGTRFDADSKSPAAVLPPGVGKATWWTRRRLIRGVIGLLCIVAIGVSVYSIYAQERKLLVKQQTQQLGMLTGSAQRSHNYLRSLESLEKGLADLPLATNREAAEEELDRLRRELPQLPARTKALDACIAQAGATNREAAIRVLNGGLDENPGTENTRKAIDLRDRLQRELNLVNSVKDVIRRAEGAPTPAESVRILQESIPHYGNAPNLQDAYDALDSHRRKQDVSAE